MHYKTGTYMGARKGLRKAIEIFDHLGKSKGRRLSGGKRARTQCFRIRGGMTLRNKL